MSRLSDSRESLLNEISSKWIKSALESKPFDKPLIRNFIVWLYRFYNLPEPQIHYASSPLASQIIAFQLKTALSKWRNLRKFNLLDMEHLIFDLPRAGRRTRHLILGKAKIASLARFYIEMQTRRIVEQLFEEFGQDYRNAQWCSFYDFCCEAGMLRKRIKAIDAYCSYVQRSGVFMTIYEEAHVIVCPNPARIMFDEQGQLHSVEGPAAAWNDGFNLQFIKGIANHTSETFLPLSSDDWYDLLLLIRDKTSEIRISLLLKHGIDIFINGWRVRVIDRWNTKWAAYELIRFNFPILKESPTYLKMLNPSTGKWHIEAVPPFGSCREALAWRDEEAEYVIPNKLT